MLVQVAVGAALKLVGIDAVDRKAGSPCGDRDALREHAADPLAELRSTCVVEPRRQHGELVAAQPPDRVQRAHRSPHPLDDPAQQVVAGRVSMEVVDRLEVVEVEQHERERTAGPDGVGQLGPNALLETAAVERLGERIGPGHEQQPVARAVVVLRLPGAQDRRERKARCYESDVGDVGVAVEIAHQQEGEDVRRADRDEDPQRVKGGGEHHREEQQQGERAARTSVGCDRDRDQADVEQAPGDEERVHHTDVVQHAPDREHRDHRAAGDTGGEQPEDQASIALIPCADRIDHAGRAHGEGEPDSGFHHVLQQLALADVDDP